MFALSAGSGCAPKSPPPDPLANPSGTFHPPPKPGSSITHTKMCECQACDPESCCQGPEEERTETCGESYDFTQGEQCGLAVRTCAARCTEHVWRIHVTKSCDAARPLVCCH